MRRSLQFGSALRDAKKKLRQQNLGLDRKLVRSIWES